MARVLILRPEADAAETAAALAGRGHVPLILPLQAIEPLEAPPPPGNFGGFVVTSAHAVPRLADVFSRDPRPVLAVGERTAGLLRAFGFGEVIVGSGDGASLEGPASALFEAGGLPLLYAAGRVRTGGLETALSRLGVGIAVWEVYDTRPLLPGEASVRAAVGGVPPDAVLILSTGQAKAYGRVAAALPDLLGAGPRALCLSPRIAAVLPVELRRSAVISDVPNLDALFDRIR